MPSTSRRDSQLLLSCRVGWHDRCWDSTGLRKLRHRGGARVDWQFLFTAAVYNLVRIRNLAAEAV